MQQVALYPNIVLENINVTLNKMCTNMQTQQGCVGWSGERETPRSHIPTGDTRSDRQVTFLAALHQLQVTFPWPPSEQINHRRAARAQDHVIPSPWLHQTEKQYSWVLSIRCHPSGYVWKEAPNIPHRTHVDMTELFIFWPVEVISKVTAKCSLCRGRGYEVAKNWGSEAWIFQQLRVKFLRNEFWFVGT